MYKYCFQGREKKIGVLVKPTVHRGETDTS